MTLNIDWNGYQKCVQGAKSGDAKVDCNNSSPDIQGFCFPISFLRQAQIFQWDKCGKAEPNTQKGRCFISFHCVCEREDVGKQGVPS